MKVSSTHNRIGAIKPRVLGRIAIAFAVAAVAAPAAQAGGPDDRQAYRGTSPALTSSSPDDRGNYRGTSPALTSSSTSPDDRGNYRGSSNTLAPTGLGPDDRAFARSVRGIELASAPVDVRPDGFDWKYVVGGTFGLALALFGLGAMVLAQRRRSTPAPA
jgi:hypothetical protein